MEDGLRRVFAILTRSLPDVAFVRLPSISPDHIMSDRIGLPKAVVAALIILAQDQTEISLDQMLEFLLELKSEIGKNPKPFMSVGVAA